MLALTPDSISDGLWGAAHGSVADVFVFLSGHVSNIRELESNLLMEYINASYLFILVDELAGVSSSPSNSRGRSCLGTPVLLHP